MIKEDQTAYQDWVDTEGKSYNGPHHLPWQAACAYKDKRIVELENDNSNAKALIGDLIQAALNDCVESLEWNEVEERVRVFLGDISEEREDD